MGDDNPARQTKPSRTRPPRHDSPDYDPDPTYYTPDQVLLVVEPRKYAEAGIASYWRVEDEDGSPTVHAYGLDGPTRSYVPTGIHRNELRTTTPFAIMPGRPFFARGRIGT